MMEPVAWRYRQDDKAMWNYSEGSAKPVLQGWVIQPLVRLSDAKARIKELEAELQSAKEDADFWRHRSSVWKKSAEEEEARAEAAEALLKEAKTALEPFAKAAVDAGTYYHDTTQASKVSHVGVLLTLGKLRAARAISDKIGVKDE